MLCCPPWKDSGQLDELHWITVLAQNLFGLACGIFSCTFILSRDWRETFLLQRKNWEYFHVSQKPIRQGRRSKERIEVLYIIV